MNIFKCLHRNITLPNSLDSAADLWPVRGCLSISLVFSGTFSKECSTQHCTLFFCSSRTLRCAQNIKQFFWLYLKRIIRWWIAPRWVIHSHPAFAKIHSSHCSRSNSLLYEWVKYQSWQKCEGNMATKQGGFSNSRGPCFPLKCNVTRKLIDVGVLLIFNCFPCNMHEQR